MNPKGPVAAAAALAAWAVSAALLPRGVPPGIVLQGVVLGSLVGLAAMGLVLIYRSARIINFAQAEIGVLAATVGIVMVAGFHLPYLVAAPVGLAVAVITGLVVEGTVVRRLADAPRLILTVATVGVAEVIEALETEIPRWFKHNLTQLTRFRTPFSDSLSFHVRPYRFDGNSVLALVLVPVVLVAVAWFLGQSDVGIAIRGTADSGERALLLGLPVRTLSRVTWMVAAGLSGLAALLQAPILGPQLGGIGGPTLLLAPLAAAVAGRMESLPRAMAAAIGIEVFEQAVFWNYSASHTVDAALFGLVLAALLLQRRQLARVDDAGLGGYVAVREVRPIPDVLRGLPEVRWARRAGLAALVLAAVLVPLAVGNARLILLTYVCLDGIVAVSLVVLTGWAGQISLGQFAFVGLGAGVGGALLVHAGADLVVAMGAGALVGAAAAVVIGIPALRIRGLFLAVATLAFAVPVSSYFLNHAYFPTITPPPGSVIPPVLLRRFPLSSHRALLYVCLSALALAVVLARNFRHSRAGRAVLSVRDNERAAGAFGISPVRAKLVAFALAGALAGMAGALQVVAQQGIPFSGFDPNLSLTVFTAVVVGGLGSLGGALLGAFYVQEASTFAGGLSFLATGAGLLVVLLFFPGGLGDLLYRIRDAALRVLARAKGLSVPSLAERPEIDPVPAEPLPGGQGILRLEDVDAGYGSIQVLFGVALDVGAGELVALLGTNGAGKSTVLRVAAGLLSPGGGRVVLDGRDITRLSPAERVAAGLVTVPGGRGVFPSLTVAENLRLAGWSSRRDRHHLAECTRRAHELFPALQARWEVRAGQLSGGEQQMLTLAMALYARPRVLLIDELSLGLAPVVVAGLLDAVRQLNRAGTAVVVVEQSVNVAAGLAQRAIFMEKGQVRFTGPTDGLLERPDLLRSVFLGSSSPPARRRARRPAVAAAPRLELEELTFHYGGVAAIEGISLEVGAGEIVGIIGSNGAGKTTLLDLCSGFITPRSGRIRLDGSEVTGLTPAGRARLGLGRSFQDARLFPSMTVADVVATACERHADVRDPVLCALHTQAVLDSEQAIAIRVEELLEELHLMRYRDAFVSELSTGTRRIVELAAAMAHGPQVLLLDEPSSGIAQRETEALGALLLEVRARTEASLVVVEHDMPLVSSIADRLVCLELGEVLVAGPPAAVLADPRVVASYLGTDPAAVTRSGARRRPRRPRARAAPS